MDKSKYTCETKQIDGIIIRNYTPIMKPDEYILMKENIEEELYHIINQHKLKC